MISDEHWQRAVKSALATIAAAGGNPNLCALCVPYRCQEPRVANSAYCYLHEVVRARGGPQCRPRIKAFGVLWVCANKVAGGVGRTPDEAYGNWRLNRGW